jgi:hypothetical protein
LRCRILFQEKNIFKILENNVDILESAFMKTTNLHTSPQFRLAGADNYPLCREGIDMS